MNRVRADVKCEACGQEPRRNEQGRLVCECPAKQWCDKAPTAGSEEDRAILEHYGWQLVELPYDIYWVGPVANAILYLYEDNSWVGESAPKRFIHLGEYLEWYAKGLR
ncbi:MAG TPA: hypothetical protein VMD58_04860 [Acidobacteriaceae bacterium]|nr:hypothetical protein [Acidobacteriaceae bacterium]